jgi:manganese transport protein
VTVSTFVLMRVRGSSIHFRGIASAVLGSWLRLIGPAFAVSIGYIDPGNWATDLAAGTFRYQLLWSVLLAGAMALIVQIAVAKLAVHTGRDLGQLIAERWKPGIPFFWAVFQVAAMATDLAEFSGIVLGLQMLCGLSVLMSVVYAIGIMLIVLVLSRREIKAVEFGFLCAVGMIATAILAQMLNLHPQWNMMLQGAGRWYFPDHGAVIAVIGIIGATIMPHNIFLHSALIVKRTQRFDKVRRDASGSVFVGETIFALAAATLINCGLLVIGAELTGGHDSLMNAFAVLQTQAPRLAPIFGAALLLSGVAATITATAAGDYIFAAFSPVAVSATMRRVLTLLPAILLLASGYSLTQLLIWSQIVLGLILPFALIPLVFIILRERVFSRTFSGFACKGALAATTCVCIILNLMMIMPQYTF